VSDAATLSRLKSLMTNKAGSAARFKAYVDSEIAGTGNWGFEPWHAALMTQVTGDMSYCNFAVGQTETFVKSEEALIGQNQRAQVAGDSYLEIGRYIGGLAIVYDWCRAQMTDAQRTRWRNYGNQAIWNVWNQQNASWGSGKFPGTGWGADDPENNYYYSFLRGTMLLGLATYGENDQAPAWLTKFRTEKIANQVVPAFDKDLQGGGSREGTGYGTSLNSLFGLYYLWEKSTGDRIADLTAHTLNSFDKAMHDIVPTLDRIAPTGDQSRDSTAALYDYHRIYLEVLSALYPSDDAAAVSKTLLSQSSVPQMSGGFNLWADFLFDQSNLTGQPLSRLPTAHWSSGTGQFSARSAWTSSATYFNFICGPYTQSHAHRDQGSFVFFKGNWLAIDENINTHSGLAQLDAAHNLIRLQQNGQDIAQNYGASCSMLALADNSTYSYALARITPMYASNTAVTKVEREFLLIKPATLVVFDRVQAGSGIARIWTLNVQGTPTVSGDRLTAVSGSNQLDVVRLAPAGLSSQVIAWSSLNTASDTEYFSGSRVDVADASDTSSRFLHVLGADHAFTNAVRSDASGQTGAQLTLADGSIATARFSTDGTGGTLDIKNASGVVTFTGTLPTSVQQPPRFAGQSSDAPVGSPSPPPPTPTPAPSPPAPPTVPAPPPSGACASDPVEPVWNEDGPSTTRIKSPAPHMHFTAGLPLRMLADVRDTNAWQCPPGHPPYVCSGTQVRFYVDGQLVGTAAPSTTDFNLWELRLPQGLAVGDHMITVTYVPYDPNSGGGATAINGEVAVTIHVDAAPTHPGTVTLTQNLVLSGSTDLEWNDKTVIGNGFKVTSAAGWSGRVNIQNSFVQGLGGFNALGISVATSGSVSIQGSIFEATGAMKFATTGSAAITVKNNELRSSNQFNYVSNDPTVPVVLELGGNTSGAKLVQGNRIGGGILLINGGDGWQIGGLSAGQGNVLMGARAVLELLDSSNDKVQGNYLLHDYHGGFSQGFNLWLQGSSSHELAEHNVIIGGSWPVQSFGGEFRYNLVVDSGHAFWRSAANATLIHHNLFVHATGTNTQYDGAVQLYNGESALDIYNNSFDVGGATGAFDAPIFNIGTGSLLRSIRNNLLMNSIDVKPTNARAFVSTADGTVTSARVTTADYNAFFNPLAPNSIRYLAGIAQNSPGAHDVQADPKLSGSNEIPYRVSSGCIWLGEDTTGRVLSHYRDLYRPAAGSPLINAGDPADGTGAAIGAIGPDTSNPVDLFGRIVP